SLDRRNDDRARERSAQRGRAAPCLREHEFRAEKRRDHKEGSRKGQEGIPASRDENGNQTPRQLSSGFGGFMLHFPNRICSRQPRGWFIISPGPIHRVMPLGVPIMPALRLLVLLACVLALVASGPSLGQDKDKAAAEAAARARELEAEKAAI